MDIRFRDRQLQRCFESESLAQRTWGPDVGQRYARRLATIQETSEFDKLFDLASLHLHPLHGDKEGYYSLTLVGRWRLIVTVEGNVVVIEEVSNHYDD